MKKLLFLIISIFVCQISVAEVAVTIYNNDRGLVRDTRVLTFPIGKGEIRFTDVASRIIPTSVHFHSERAELLEQNYEFDLVDAKKILTKYIDHRIQLFTEGGESFAGTLLAGSGDVVIREDDNSIRVISSERVLNYLFPTLPEGLITKPTLVWKVNSSNGGQGEGEVSYLTQGISWTTEYVAVSDKEDKSLEFTGWVNIDNKCGTSYKDARLKLMAGDVQILRDGGYRLTQEAIVTSFGSNSGDSRFQEESLYDYHLYSLNGRSTILNNQIKQIALFPSADVKEVKKEYFVEWSSTKGKVRVSLLFDNTQENGLGIPLPKGKVRVYKESKGGDLEFVGEDRIGHSPQKEGVRIKTGYAFDFACEKKQLERKRVEDEYDEDEYRRWKIWEEEWELRIRNRKEERAEVIVPARLSGDWTIIDATPGWEKTSSNKIRWTVAIEPDEEIILNYRVRFKR